MKYSTLFTAILKKQVCSLQFAIAISLLTANFLLPTFSSAQSWLWAKQSTGTKFIQGNGNNGIVSEGYGVATDASGNAYITGSFTAATLTFGSTTLTKISNGGANTDFFLAKYDASGNVLWAKNAGGAGGWNSGEGKSIALDASGNAYITGYFTGTITFGTTTLSTTGWEDFFLVKYDASGTVLWAKSESAATGAFRDYGMGVAVDASGNVFVTGYFLSTSITIGTTTLTNTGTNGDIFLVKYDPSGTVLWAKSAGGTGDDASYGVAVDASGNVYITGNFEFPSITFGTTTLTNTFAKGDIFLAKYDASGTVLWAKSAGGAGGDAGYSVATDASGNVYLTGYFGKPNIAFGTTTLSTAANRDVFLAKYDASGTVLWAKSESTASGNLNIAGYSVATDASGNAYIAGSFGYPIGATSLSFGTITLNNPSGSADAVFIVEYDPNGTAICGSSLDGGGEDGLGIATNALGDVYVSGDFIVSPMAVGTTTLTVTLLEDIYIAKWQPCAPTTLTATASPTHIKCKGLCTGTAAAAANGTPPYTYSWNSTPIQTTQTATGLCVGTYTVTVTDGVPNTIMATVSITQPATMLTATVSSAPAACGGNNGSATITAGGGTPGYSYSWNTTPIQTTANATGLSAVVYTVTVTDANACPQTKTVTVTSNNALTLNVSSTQTGCTVNNGSALATPANGTAPYTYNWSNGQTTTTATGLAAGDYTVVVTDTYSCTQTQTVSVTQIPGASVSASANPNTIAPGDSTTLTASGAGPYQWSPSTGLSCSTCANPTAKPVQTTTYCVTVTNTNGCSGSDCIIITVEIPCGTRILYLPNAFSPNGDEENDELKIYTENLNCIKEYHLAIYNRWGEKVFESFDQKTGWDGTYKGNLLDTAVFDYYLDATLASGEKINRKGNISLMR